MCAFGLAAAYAQSDRKAAFQHDMQVAMDRMMADMMVKPSGDVDRDFAAMMIPHHQGAIDMAKAELLYGHNEVLRRIAQGIVVEQQQEIEVMREAADLAASPAAPATAMPMHGSHN